MPTCPRLDHAEADQKRVVTTLIMGLNNIIENTRERYGTKVTVSEN